MKSVLKILSLVLPAVMLAGCEEQSTVRPATTVAMPSVTLAYGGDDYVIRRHLITYVDGREDQSWAILIGGQFYPCSFPSLDGCRETLRWRERHGRGPGPG
ncbi:hypothetical protein [Actibacterium sp. D379-3]